MFRRDGCFPWLDNMVVRDGWTGCYFSLVGLDGCLGRLDGMVVFDACGCPTVGSVFALRHALGATWGLVSLQRVR